MRETQPLQGQLKWAGGATWYEIHGPTSQSISEAAIIVVHGGPGMTHDYLLNLSALSADRKVIFYDQIGNGRSNPVGAEAAQGMSLAFMVEELEALLEELIGRDEYILLAHSAGGCIATEHALRRPAGLKALILANCFPSGALMQAGLRDRARELSPEYNAALIAGPGQHSIHSAAMGEFFTRFVCRVPPPPELLQTLQALTALPQIQNKLIGENLFNWNGPLAQWSVVDRLPDINVPALVLSGACDETGPLCPDTFARGLVGCRTRTFANSSHVPHIEEQQAVFEEVLAFVTSVTKFGKIVTAQSNL